VFSQLIVGLLATIALPFDAASAVVSDKAEDAENPREL